MKQSEYPPAELRYGENLVAIEYFNFHKDDAYDTEEGCLSLLGGPRKCKRYKTIRVQYQTLEMQTRTKNFTGWTAQIIQHEVDHCKCGVDLWRFANGIDVIFGKVVRCPAFRKKP